jgi:hypothetical protein
MKSLIIRVNFKAPIRQPDGINLAQIWQKPVTNLAITVLSKCMRFRFFVESRAPRGSPQKIWFYLSAKRCIKLVVISFQS